jgi:hypothetical protein
MSGSSLGSKSVADRGRAAFASGKRGRRAPQRLRLRSSFAASKAEDDRPDDAVARAAYYYETIVSEFPARKSRASLWNWRKDCRSQGSSRSARGSRGARR